ncbi:MAG: hypothetical protein ACM3PY_10780, partial [Omnitrophica WOR_2 bacterium]
PLVAAIMKGILPATIGLSLAMGVQMALPLFSKASKEGRARLGAHIFILLAAALLMGLTSVSPVVVLLFAGSSAVVLFALLPALKPKQMGDKGR